ncbi:MAG: hypothetical protein ACTSU2_10055 [Promethearchaeota archaeon]
MIIHILLLVLVNVLFAIAPLFVGELQGMSPFSISFFRFFGAGLIEFLFIILILINFKRELSKSGVKIAYFSLFTEIFRNYYRIPNNRFLKGRKQIYYIIFLGFLLSDLSVPFYFLSFSLAGLVISTIFVNSSTLLLIALINGIKKEENFDMLKIMDLSLLVAAIFTIAYSNSNAQIHKIDVTGFFTIIVVIMAYTSFLMWIPRDGTSIKKFISKINISLLRNSRKLQQKALLTRSLIKLMTMHIFGGLLLIPFSLFLTLLIPDTIIGQVTLEFLTKDLLSFFQKVFNPSVMALIIFCTALPYFFLVYTGVTWPKNALKQDMWSSIFALIDPLIGLYIGYFIWNEAIRFDYVIFTTIFLVVAIIIRYFHEIANSKRFIFIIKLKNNQFENFLKYMEKIREIDRISLLFGTFNLVVFVTVQTMSRLAYIADRINYFAGLKSAYYSALLKRKSKKEKRKLKIERELKRD